MKKEKGFVVVCSYQLLLSESDLTLCSSVWTLESEKLKL